MVTGYITSLTDDDREEVLIIDESTHDRSRSKGVELLARVYDYCTKRYLKGFRLLTLGWSDGASLVPLDFALLSSADEEKLYLDLVKSVQIRDFDGLIAYTTIAMMRYTSLSYEQRLHDDPRTFGEIFYACCDEIKDLSLLEALQRILTLTIHNLRKTSVLSEQIVQEMLDALMGAVKELFILKPSLMQVTA